MVSELLQVWGRHGEKGKENDERPGYGQGVCEFWVWVKSAVYASWMIERICLIINLTRTRKKVSESV